MGNEMIKEFLRWIKCDECDGEGQTLNYDPSPEGGEYWTDCPTCHGTGEIHPRDYYASIEIDGTRNRFDGRVY